jgi:hypothetical protein
MFCAASGALVGAIIGALDDGEIRLWRSMLHLLKKGDVVVADRYYGSFGDLALLTARGVDCLMRLHHRRLFRKAGRRDYITIWHKPKVCPKSMSADTFRSLPETLRVRIIRCRINRPGKRTRRVVLVTTLLDRDEYPAEELEQLYCRRWEVEVNLDHLKTTLGMDVLSAETPEVVIKEVWAHFLAYNLLRAIMWEAGERYNVDPLRLSLRAVVQEALAHRYYVGVFEPHTVLDMIVSVVQSSKIPHRPDRYEPRVRKRRPKEYTLMNQPREVLRSKMAHEA